MASSGAFEYLLIGSSQGTSTKRAIKSFQLLWLQTNSHCYDDGLSLGLLWFVKTGSHISVLHTLEMMIDIYYYT